MKTKAQSEPKKLDKDMVAPKGYKNTLDEQEAKRVARREMLNKEFNKIVKDPF